MTFCRTRHTIAAACLLLAASAFAQTPPTPPVPLAPRAEPVQQTVTGRIQQWLINPNGDIDGLLLDSGTQVSFPPHLSESLLQAVKLKDAVQVTGRRGVSGATLRADEIRNTATGRSVADQPPPKPGRRALRDDAALTAMNASGRITRVLYSGRGDANGALLDSGTVVRFPPHVGVVMASTLAVGQPLYARGYGTRNAHGSALEATQIGASLETAQDVFAGPRGGPAARPPRPHHPHPPAGPGAGARAGADTPPPPVAPAPPAAPTPAR
jgi:hypothetical protein